MSALNKQEQAQFVELNSEEIQKEANKIVAELIIEHGYKRTRLILEQSVLNIKMSNEIEQFS
jgi:hypothetical protein